MARNAASLWDTALPLLIATIVGGGITLLVNLVVQLIEDKRKKIARARSLLRKIQEIMIRFVQTKAFFDHEMLGMNLEMLETEMLGINLKNDDAVQLPCRRLVNYFDNIIFTDEEISLLTSIDIDLFWSLQKLDSWQRKINSITKQLHLAQQAILNNPESYLSIQALEKEIIKNGSDVIGSYVPRSWSIIKKMETTLNSRFDLKIRTIDEWLNWRPDLGFALYPLDETHDT